MIQLINVDSYRASIDGYARELRELAPYSPHFEFRTFRTEQELVDGCAEADIILVEHPDTPISARVIQSLYRCRLIVKYGVGIDNIDLAAATKHGIVVCNAADYCTEEVSDHAVALLLSCARQIYFFDRRVREGAWHEERPPRPLRRVSQQTAGLLGFGRIARAVAKKLRGFQMRIIAHDPHIPPQSFQSEGVESVAFDELLQASDYLSLHLPLTEATLHLIGTRELARMRSGAFLINTSRGPIVEEAALIRALQNGGIAGAALDVTECEPPPASHILRHLSNVILTPHFGATSVEAADHLRATVIHSIAALLDGYWPPFPQNPSVAPRRALRSFDEWPGLRKVYA
jgi:D-3-phosphoglycerate dehydrogenase